MGRDECGYIAKRQEGDDSNYKFRQKDDESKYRWNIQDEMLKGLSSS